jgi:hypothetical protein
MMRQGRRRNFKPSGALILLAIAYCGLLFSQRTLTGRYKLDGMIGVLVGLFICSHPAANMLDMLLFGRVVSLQGSSKQSEAVWVALNVLVMLCGWIVIFIGTTRFVQFK